MTPITYEQSRNFIRDGDIISIFRSKNNPSLFSRIITAWTKSPIYHTAIAVWLKIDSGEKRLFVVEADASTRRIIPLSTYQYHQMHVLAKPESVNFELFSSSLLERVGTAKYSYTKAIISGLRHYLELPKVVVATGEFCSELAAKMWKMGGMDITDTSLDPDHLERMLVEEFGVEYRCWILPS